MRLLALVFALAGACGGARYAGGVYRDADARYAVAPPGAGWTRVEAAGDNDLAWREPALGAVVQTNARCTPDLDIPLEALTAHLLIGWTEREDRQEERIPFDGREALRTELRAKLDGVERGLVFVVMKKDGCVYDFALVAPPSRLAEARAAFDEVLGSFTTQPRRP